MRDFRKQSIYLTTHLLDAVRYESERLGQSISWVVRQSMQHGLHYIRETPEKPARRDAAQKEMFRD